MVLWRSFGRPPSARSRAGMFHSRSKPQLPWGSYPHNCTSNVSGVWWLTPHRFIIYINSETIWRYLSRMSKNTVDLEEWYVDSGAGSVLCSCSTHRHKLEVADLLPLLADTARLKEDEFQDFVKGHARALHHKSWGIVPKVVDMF